jgi:hypothetical protein
MPDIATSMMAGLYGAVRTWDPDITLTDLFGYSGHAFILNIERTLCPSGPTAWDWGAILFPLRQIFSLRRLCATCDMRGPEEARELIWQRTVDSINAGRPSVLWDAVYPEFYLAYGHDADTGDYLVHGPGADTVHGRVSWAKLGSNIGQVWAIFPGPSETRDLTSARDLSLRGAVTWHRWLNEPDAQWTFGGGAWDVWITAIAEEELGFNSNSVAYNHVVYAECRRHAARFLAAQGALYADAAAAYDRVATELEAVCATWPLLNPVPDLAVRRELAQRLTTARDAEAEGIAALEIVLEQQRAARV